VSNRAKQTGGQLRTDDAGAVLRSALCPAAVLLQELGELPAVEWKRQVLRFWSVLTALPETAIFKQAAMEQIRGTAS